MRLIIISYIHCNAAELCICITCIIVAPPSYVHAATSVHIATSTVCFANYNVHYLKFPHNHRILVTTQNKSCTSHILLHCINCSTVKSNFLQNSNFPKHCVLSTCKTILKTKNKLIFFTNKSMLNTIEKYNNK
ncbi:hypothetical protein NP493_202g03008 [Ridgeia piscesae]|uniref:Uncharacterized protein n=1 Tax=Ridgeia piscesae TaxID=27915 RepID=A0AAD9UEJ5_RIDPI|nr:hypothetical protein NP493_202g03008 [Ridgeia piscesae]